MAYNTGVGNKTKTTVGGGMNTTVGGGMNTTAGSGGNVVNNIPTAVMDTQTNPLTKDQWSQIKYTWLKAQDRKDSNMVNAIMVGLDKMGYKPIANDWFTTLNMGEQTGGNKYADLQLKGQSFIPAMVQDVLGRVPTAAEMQQLSAGYEQFIATQSPDNPYNYQGFVNQFAINPGMWSTEIAKNQKDIEQKQYVEKQLADPNAPLTKLKQLQETELSAKLSEQQEVAKKQLADILSARGMGQSGALVGGQTQIESDMQKALSSGQTQIGQQYQQALATGSNEAGQSYMTDVANAIANQYQQNMAERYYKEMQNLENQNQGGLGSVLGTVIGGGIGLIPGMQALGPLAGATIGGGLGSLIDPPRRRR